MTGSELQVGGGSQKPTSDMVYWAELEQEPYDPEEFVERLVSGNISGTPEHKAFC